MGNHFRKQVFNNLNLKETDELVMIWKKNHRYEWSDIAFDIIKEILQNRLDELPPQHLPHYDPSEPDVNEESTDEWQQIRSLSENGWLKGLIDVFKDEVKPPVEAEPEKPIPVGVAILGLLLFGSLALLVFFLVGQSVTDLINDMKSSGWPTTSSHIISSNVEEWQESGDTYFGPRVEYEYVVGGHSYRSERIRFGGFVPTLPDRMREAIEVSHRYRPGETVQVYFDPSAPSLSVLEPGVGKIRILSFLAILMFLFVISCLYARACMRSVLDRSHPKRD